MRQVNNLNEISDPVNNEVFFNNTSGELEIQKKDDDVVFTSQYNIDESFLLFLTKISNDFSEQNGNIVFINNTMTIGGD